MTATILVVDDLLPNLKLLEAKLSSEYYDVLLAKNAFEALDIVEKKSVDIILLDVMMPEMDGFECCKKLKANIKTSHIPVVMVTALNEVEDRIQGLEAGADDFLTKPINDLALFARIRSLTRIKIMLDELRMRDQTEGQLGLNNIVIDKNKEISGARILIVEDDIVQAKHISSKLTEIKDIFVEIISEGKLMLEKVVNGNYDLVIISTQLANEDGLRLCSHIRSLEKVRHIPLLILVEASDTNTLVKGLDLGVNDYLVTPIESNEVLARVTTQIRRKRYQDQLKNNYKQSFNLAITDGLTGLHNRHYFDTHCKNLIEQTLAIHSNLLILMIVDVDHFKQVNDTYGHVVGDEILKQIAGKLTGNFRPTDLVARFGGEEFVIIMPSTDIKFASEIAERIRKNIEENPFKISAGEGILHKTISIGVTGLRNDDNVESMLKRADKALYKAKETGRNKVIIASDVD